MTEVLDRSTGAIVEVDHDVLARQEKLFGDFDDVEIYEIAITGASGLIGGEELGLGQEVRLTVRGRVVAISQQIKLRKAEDGDEEILVRRATIKAAGARVEKSE